MSREKQIKEMAEVIDAYTEPLSARDIHKAEFSEQFAEALYNAGYRKQSEGEWVHGENEMAHCSECGNEEPSHSISPYCPECGARMEDDAE